MFSSKYDNHSTNRRLFTVEEGTLGAAAVAVASVPSALSVPAVLLAVVSTGVPAMEVVLAAVVVEVVEVATASTSTSMEAVSTSLTLSQGRH